MVKHWRVQTESCTNKLWQCTNIAGNLVCDYILNGSHGNLKRKVMNFLGRVILMPIYALIRVLSSAIRDIRYPRFLSYRWKMFEISFVIIIESDTIRCGIIQLCDTKQCDTMQSGTIQCHTIRQSSTVLQYSVIQTVTKLVVMMSMTKNFLNVYVFSFAFIYYLF